MRRVRTKSANVERPLAIIPPSSTPINFGQDRYCSVYEGVVDSPICLRRSWPGVSPKQSGIFFELKHRAWSFRCPAKRAQHRNFWIKRIHVTNHQTRPNKHGRLGFPAKAIFETSLARPAALRRDGNLEARKYPSMPKKYLSPREKTTHNPRQLAHIIEI